MLTAEEVATIERGRGREIVVEFDGGPCVIARGEDATVLAFELGGWRPKPGRDGRPVAEFDVRHHAVRFRRLVALGMRFRVDRRGDTASGGHFLDGAARAEHRALVDSTFGTAAADAKGIALGVGE